MVYKTKGNRRYKKRSGRARFKRYGAKAGSMAYTALKMAKRLKDMVNTEYKYQDAAWSIAPSFNGSLNVLNDIPQGAADTQRIGDSLKMQNISFRYNVVLNPAATSTLVRVIVLLDKQARISAPNEVLQVTGASTAPMSPKYYDTRFQSRFLYDRMHVLSSTATSSAYADVTIPINLHAQFLTGSTGLTTGRLYLLVISNVNTNLPSFSGISHITFSDN